MKACPTDTPGTVWFKTATPFEYFNDPNKTKEARSPDGSMSTVATSAMSTATAISI